MGWPVSFGLSTELGESLSVANEKAGPLAAGLLGLCVEQYNGAVFACASDQSECIDACADAGTSMDRLVEMIGLYWASVLEMMFVQQ
jgi:hypothetical protein